MEQQQTLWDDRPSSKPKASHPAEFKIVRLRELPPTSSLLDTPQGVYDYWMQNVTKSAWYNSEVEQLVTLMLNTRRRCVGFNLVAMGILDTILSHPREIYRTAIVASASAIILAHNHPSGDAGPSEADIRVTKTVEEAGKLLQIPLLDHVVIGSASVNPSHPFTSLREMGYLHGG